jgi:hypothetical protein
LINLNNLSQNSIIVYINTLAVENNPWNTNNFLFIFKNGFAREPIAVVPNIVKQNPRYTEFEITLTVTNAQDPINGIVSLSPSGNWDYELWAVNAPSLDPEPGVLINRGQMFLENGFQEIPDVTYISDNESSKSVVYLTRKPNECAVWSTFPDVWNLSTLVWNNCI